MDTSFHKFCVEFPTICEDISNWFHLVSIYEDTAASNFQNSLPFSPSSVKSIIHYAQIITSGEFKQYDYGNNDDNMAHYNSTDIPMLHLENIPKDLPIGIWAGLQDMFANRIDVPWLKEKLGDRVIHYQTIDQFDHFSFQIGKNMTFTKDVVDLLKSYNY